jgi:hypothetical protein
MFPPRFLKAFIHSSCERRLCGKSSPTSGHGSSPDESWFNRMQSLVMMTPNQLRGAIEDASGDKEKLKNLMDYNNWFTVFRKYGSLFTDESYDPPDDADKKIQYVIEALRPLSLVDRQRIFMSYVDRFIPPEALTGEYEYIVPSDEKDSDTRFNAMIKSGDFSTITGAFGAIVGADVPDEDTDEYKIAVSSLMHRYGISKDNKPEDIAHVSRHLIDDFQEAFRGQRPALQSILTSPSDAAELMESSPILGALRLGVIDKPVLNLLTQDMESLRDESSAVTARTAASLAPLREQNDRALGLRETWRAMGGIEKIVLIAGLIWAMRLDNNFGKLMRRLGITGFAVYFGSKFLMGGKDPFEVLNTGLRKMRGEGDEILAIADEQRALFDLLSQQDRHDIEREIKGIGHMCNIPLRDISRNFISHGRGEETQYALNLDRASTLREQLINTMGGREYREFFDAKDKDTDIFTYRPNIIEGLSFIFYDIGRDDPEVAKRVLEVEDAVGKMSGRDGYPALKGSARGSYIAVVNHGREKALKMSMVLGKYIIDRSDQNKPAPEEERPSSMAEILFKDDPEMQDKVRALEDKKWSFEIVDDTGGKEWMKIMGPPVPGSASRINIINDQSRHSFYAPIEDAKTIIKKRIMASHFPKKTYDIIFEQLKRPECSVSHINHEMLEVGATIPSVIDHVSYNRNTQEILITIAGRTPAFSIPASVWMERTLLGESPAKIIADRAIQIVPALPSIYRLSSDIDAVFNDELTTMENEHKLGVWNATAIREVMQNNMWFRRCVFLALNKALVQKEGSIPNQMKKILKLSDTTAGAKEALVQVKDASVSLKDRGDRFVPRIRLTAVFGDEHEEIIDTVVPEQSMEKKKI